MFETYSLTKKYPVNIVVQTYYTLNNANIKKYLCFFFQNSFSEPTFYTH